jgi:alpha-N-acetylglucosaminidase
MKYFLFAILLFCSSSLYCQTRNIIAANALVKRIAPHLTSKIIFEELQTDTPKDLFELESKKGRIIIRGNNANSMAVGFNYYLKHYCVVSISWYKDDAPVMPSVLPPVPEKHRQEARVDKRFILNYCTFGYTMPWWNWNDWQWFIDWMALNGINMPLAITGQEAVWYKVWKKFGLSDTEIRTYFTGPAYLPWHRMANIDHWDGPLPQSWLDNQLALQKQIVARERELNMTPVLPAFAGHVPEVLKKKYPAAKITSLGEWGDFDKQYQSYFLDPFDSLFNPIQKEFLQEQTKLFGTNHVYGTDPFNEVTPPSWEPAYLASVANTIYHSMTAVDAKAEWLQMSWIFYFMRDKWTDERIKAFITAVPQNKMILLDYFCENTEIWKITHSFYGQPFIWCYLGNFGGNTMLTGYIKEVGSRMENTFKNAGQNMWGIGSTLEGFGVNPVIFEYVFDKAWSNGSVDAAQWMDDWAMRRYGHSDSNVTKAWQLLLNSAYANSDALGQATLTNARPCLKEHAAWTTSNEIGYNNHDLLEAWQLLLKPTAKASQPGVYEFDVTNVGRQVLGNYFTVLRDQFTAAYNHKDLIGLEQKGKEMIALLNDMDTLLSTHFSFLLGRWIEGARAIGTTAAEKNYYETDAKRIITTWGEKGRGLNEYANRNWAGLTKTYYAERWKLFIKDVITAVKNKQDFNEKQFLKEVVDFEGDWVLQQQKFSTKPAGNCLGLNRMLFAKYVDAIRNTK